MLKKLIDYVDYNGVKRSENFYFNLNETELIEMNLSVDGGMQELIESMMNKQDIPKIMSSFKMIILKAYGEKDANGRVFHKSEELSRAFSQTEAYNVLYMELLSDAKKAAEFINAILPEKFREDAKGESPDAVLTPVGEDSPSLAPAN